MGLQYHLKIQGYPHRMRFQRRLHGVDTVCFLKFLILWKYKLISFFDKSLNKPRRLDFNLNSSYFKSSLQSHPLWVNPVYLITTWPVLVYNAIYMLCINLACLSVCLSVCLYPINVKTAEPIGPKFFVGHHVTTGKV